MSFGRFGRCAGLAAIVVLAAACDTGVAPEMDQGFESDAALEDYRALESVLASEQFRAFQLLGAGTPFGGETEGAAPAPIISGFHRGATFVFDPQTDRYVVDPDREGAPPTGVRFVIYEIAPSGDPRVDTEIGHADLIDEGDGSAEDIALHLVVTQHDQVVLDYRTTLDSNGNDGTVTVEGFLFGDGVRLDFDIGAYATGPAGDQTVDVDFGLRVDERSFAVDGSVRGADHHRDGEGEIDITVRHRAETLRLSAIGSEGMIDGSVLLNGDVFATVSGLLAAPVFRNADGGALSFGEFLVLRHVIDSIEDVFDFLEDLLDPIDELVTIGIVL